MQATGLGETGNLYHHIGDYDTALDYLQQSLAIQKAIGDQQGESVTLNNIATIFDARGDYDSALDYQQQSLAIRKAIGDLPGLGITLFNIGMGHLKQQQTQEAMASFVQAYQIAQQVNAFELLKALEGLAKQLGGEGLSYWENLSQQVSASQKAHEHCRLRYRLFSGIFEPLKIAMRAWYIKLNIKITVQPRMNKILTWQEIEKILVISGFSWLTLSG